MKQDQHQTKSDMRLDKKGVHSVEYSCQLAIQDVCAAELYLEQKQGVRKSSYFFAALTRDTTSLSRSL